MKYDQIFFGFQGGGALGAYQVGVVTALHESGYHPNWVVGTSIGAINAAIVAGNKPEDRIEKLHQFWSKISTPDIFDTDIIHTDIITQRLSHYWSSLSALLFGQPGFFKPRLLSPILDLENSPDKISFYDTTELRSTLEQLIDFDLINHKKNNHAIRLSVGTVEVCDGDMIYFDTEKHKIGPEHIMASAALPPGFPAVRIEDKFYWDGGISSNSPLNYILDDEGYGTALCFLVHLFDSYGVTPKNFDDILKRRKDIEFSSKFFNLIKLRKDSHHLKYTINQLAKLIPDDKKKDIKIQKMLSHGCDRAISLVRFLYRGSPADLSSKDYEFSRQSCEQYIAKGYQDTKHGLKTSPWLKPIPETAGIALYDMTEENLDG